MHQLSEILCHQGQESDKLMLKPCMYHQRVGQPDNEWIEPADTIIIRKTLNNESDDYTRPSSNKVRKENVESRSDRRQQCKEISKTRDTTR